MTKFMPGHEIYKMNVKHDVAPESKKVHIKQTNQSYTDGDISKGHRGQMMLYTVKVKTI